MSKVPDLISKCKRCGMYAMALTDHGNMYGIKELVDCAKKENGRVKDRIKEQQRLINDTSLSDEEHAAAQKQIAELEQTFFKPIIGIEAYCAKMSRFERDGRGWHLILLAKNKTGYRNLCKLSSYAFTEGFYYTPRLDHELLERYHEGVICASACLGGEVPQKILKGDLSGAEESVLWFKSVYGDDYYLELQRHQTDKPNAATDTYENQQVVNKVLVELARKHNIKLIATNDVHFVEEEHGEAHDRLICLSTGKDYDDPTRMHYTKQEWLKSPAEMAAIFSDLPEAIANTQEVVDKVENYSIDSDPIMPVFPIPAEFGTEEEYRSRIRVQELFDEFTRNDVGEVVLSQEEAEKKIHKLGGYDKLYRIKFEADYLAKLTYDGAHKRYGEQLTTEQQERIRFELHTIKTMGFPGYFLIVQDYIRAAREQLGVSVGPGRGSAAGSVVAYCLWITDIDPLKYDLLFERFLNPDRISLPDIDVDFDDAGRGKVLDWITDKYGKEKVAHIITYGTMAAKSSLADVGRVQRVPLSEVNRIKSYVPDRSFPDSVKDEKGKSPKVNLKNCYKYVPELHEIMEGSDESLKSMLTYAEELEDTNRQTGIHACGVIIGADDLTNFAPVCTIKDKETGQDVLVTQYDGHVVESVGLIKMDFLGLKNLTIIKDCIETIRKTTGDEVDIDHIPIDDELTYKLYCEGNTLATFQFESAGMQKYLKELQPHVFEDLIAMNALYRPGPMDYIPLFIRRKLGQEPIEYPIPEMEKYLKETYGVTVYQEQVMLLSRQLAGFTRGESDTLRKAMGKKQIEKMLELKGKFLEQGAANGHDPKVLEQIWADWEKFASYAFNKSHATCYSWVAYQTAYLKAHYPAQYMAAVLTSSLSEITRLTQLLEECRRMKIDVLSPDVNESDLEFSVNKKGQIRFGLAAIKGMGEAAAQVIISEREERGPYTDIFDLLTRISMRSVNRKNLEVLAKSGAFDSFGMHRAQYFFKEMASESSPTFIERLTRWAVRQEEQSAMSQMSIFDMSDEIKGEAHPQVPECAEWSNLERCRYEKEVIGFYLSGHPLDDFKVELSSYTNVSISSLSNLEKYVGSNVRFGGVVTAAVTGMTKRGSRMCSLTIEDYDGSIVLKLYDNNYVNFSGYCAEGLYLWVQALVEQRVFRDEKQQLQSRPPVLTVKKMMLLGSVIDELTKRVEFDLKLSDLNEEVCKGFEACMKSRKKDENVKPVKLEAHVINSEKGIVLTMKSSTVVVQPSELVSALQAIPEVSNIKVKEFE